MRSRLVRLLITDDAWQPKNTVHRGHLSLPIRLCPLQLYDYNRICCCELDYELSGSQSVYDTNTDMIQRRPVGGWRVWERATHSTECRERAREGDVTVTERHIKTVSITLQPSNCRERKGLWEHIGDSWSQPPKPAKRQIRESEITVKYCLPGKGGRVG